MEKEGTFEVRRFAFGHTIFSVKAVVNLRCNNPFASRSSIIQVKTINIHLRKTYFLSQ